MSVSVEQPAVVAEEEPRRESRALDLTLRVAGVIITILATIFSGLLEIFLSTLRIGGVLTGVSIPLAVVTNVAIALVRGRQHRAALGPGAAVGALDAEMLAAAGIRTTEGDYLLSGDNWIALVMILVGSLTFAVFSYRMILKRVSVPNQ